MKAAVLLVLVCCACSPLHLKKTDFEYYQDEKKQYLVFRVPKGFQEEKQVLDTNGGKEKFYYYGYGALFYVARDVTWLTENQPLIENARPAVSGDSSHIFKGVDKDGLFWKEIRVEGFRYGYSYVPAAHLEKFEDAIHSVRFRKRYY